MTEKLEFCEAPHALLDSTSSTYLFYSFTTWLRPQCSHPLVVTVQKLRSTLSYQLLLQTQLPLIWKFCQYLPTWSWKLLSGSSIPNLMTHLKFFFFLKLEFHFLPSRNGSHSLSHKLLNTERGIIMCWLTSCTTDSHFCATFRTLQILL